MGVQQRGRIFGMQERVGFLPGKMVGRGEKGGGAKGEMRVKRVKMWQQKGYNGC